MDKIVTLQQAARFFGCSYNGLQRAVKDGRIKYAHKVGLRWYINASREWPLLFGDEEEAARALQARTAKTEMGFPS